MRTASWSRWRTLRTSRLGTTSLQADRIAQLWYEGSYPAMAEAYLSGATAEWTQLKSRGDSLNRLELAMNA